jgi:hypothetical protein
MWRLAFGGRGLSERERAHAGCTSSRAWGDQFEPAFLFGLRRGACYARLYTRAHLALLKAWVERQL